MSFSSILSIPAFTTIQEILTDSSAADKFLFEKGALYPQPVCSTCSGPTKRKGDLWVCLKKRCAKAVSIYRGSFFGNARLNCAQILHIAYLWLCKVPSSSATIMTGHNKNTISNYFGFLNQLAGDNIREEDTVIGGQDIIVEVDECKIAKRKYNRGHRVDGAWIVGSVERTAERRVFVVRVQDRSAETLRDVISRYVKQGSSIHTDLWKGYSGLAELGIEHGTVNHSKHFKDPETGIHTNTIEGTWAGLKRAIPVRNRSKDSVDEHLQCFIWRRQNERDLWVDS